MRQKRDLPPIPVFAGGRRLVIGGLLAAVLGLIIVAVGFFIDSTRTFLAYLTAFSAVTAVGLGALAFLMIVLAMQATWPLIVRRQTESVAMILGLMALFFVPLIFGIDQLYMWSEGADRGELPHHMEVLIEKKRVYLDEAFFVGRSVFYFVSWLVPLVLLFLWGRRIEAPQFAPDEAWGLKNRMRLLASALLPLAGVALTFAAFDWLMSLHPEWYSSIFGVYYFASSILPAIALITLMTQRLEHGGWLRPFVTSSHYYALGRLLLAFVVFWAYITFFQFFIIWMANRPESVSWYIARVGEPWGELAIFLIATHFLVPFVCLLSYKLKRRGPPLAFLSIWILVVHYLHMHWVVVPSNPDAAPVHIWDLGALLLMGGSAVALVTALMRGRPVLPHGHPDLVKGLEYRSA